MTPNPLPRLSPCEALVVAGWLGLYALAATGALVAPLLRRKPHGDR